MWTGDTRFRRVDGFRRGLERTVWSDSLPVASPRQNWSTGRNICTWSKTDFPAAGPCTCYRCVTILSSECNPV